METESTSTIVIGGKRVTLSRVTSVVDVGPRAVYDLSVRDVHNYYAGGMNVHNCDYHAWLKYHGNRMGVELATLNQQSYFYQHRQLLIHPSGPNRKTLRGKTRFAGMCDELDFLTAGDDSDAIKMNAREVFISMNNSMATLRVAWRQRIREGFNNTPNALFIGVSSPQDSKGFLTRRVKQLANSRNVMAVHAATWEIHPKLTRKRLQPFFDDDEVAATRDLGAQPPTVDNPFMREDQVEVMARTGLVNRVAYKYEEKPTRDGSSTRRWGNIVKIRQHTRIPPSIMGIDAGLTFNSFSLVIGHKEEDRAKKTRIILDAMVEVMPVKGKVSINYSKMYSAMIRELIWTFNVKMVYADRWNSAKLFHDIEEDCKTVVAGAYQLKPADFQQYKSWCEEGAVHAPPATREFSKLMDESMAHDSDKAALPYPQCFDMRAVDHFYFQHLTVKEEGNQVTKGNGLTDDLFRASCLTVTQLLNPKNKKYLRGWGRGRSSSLIGSMGEGSGGWGGSDNGTGSIGSIGGGGFTDSDFRPSDPNSRAIGA